MVQLCHTIVRFEELDTKVGEFNSYDKSEINSFRYTEFTRWRNERRYKFGTGNDHGKLLLNRLGQIGLSIAES